MILKDINPEYSLEGLVLRWSSNTLAPWCKDPWCWERLRPRGEGDDREWDGWMASLTQWTWVWARSGVGDGQGGLVCCSPWGHNVSDMTEWLNWTVYTIVLNFLFYTFRPNQACYHRKCGFCSLIKITDNGSTILSVWKNRPHRLIQWGPEYFH